MRTLLALILSSVAVLADDLPKVLILGDSISMGYTPPVTTMLAKEAVVSRPRENCQYTAFGLGQLDKWLGDTKWDVIHFNFGLHDLKFIAQELPDATILRKRGAALRETPGAHQVATVDDYAANLGKMVQRLQKTGASLVFATTTPVPEGATGRLPGDAAKYNQAALEVMKRHGVAVNDLWGFAAWRLADIQRPRDVHFTKDGSTALADEVVTHIRTALATRRDGPGADRAATRPNVVFIMADDLGYGDLACYGSETIRTPHLDALAASGLRLTDYHSNGAVCSPTRAALMTGCYQQRVGVPGVINARAMRDTGMALEHRTVAEALRDQGYRTALFGKWHLGYPAAFNPVKQGFDEFRGFVSGNVDYHTHVDQAGYFDWWQQDELKDEPGYITDLINGHGVEFIKRQQAGTPFLLMLMHGAPHYPYQGRQTPGFREAGKPVVRQKGIDIPAVYTEMIEVMDEGIGKVVTQLEAQGLRDNTLVIFCSDNGPTRNGSAGGFRGFKGSVWEGGHRVPGIVTWPARIAAGSTSGATVVGFDWFPTFLEAAGAPIPDGLDGRSVLGHLSRREPLAERPLVWQHGSETAVREGPWKLVVPKSGEAGLFNLAKDRAESHNLATDQPDRAGRLRQILASWESSVRPN